jgi:hypothetical protein
MSMDVQLQFLAQAGLRASVFVCWAWTYEYAALGYLLTNSGFSLKRNFPAPGSERENDP